MAQNAGNTLRRRVDGAEATFEFPELRLQLDIGAGPQRHQSDGTLPARTREIYTIR